MNVSSSKSRTTVRCHTQRERSTLYMRRPLIVKMLKTWSPGTVTAGIFLLARRQAGLHGVQKRQTVLWDA
jgi:hypothetical protein